jgi:hypothetical protein
MHNLTVPKILLGLLFMACASTTDPLFADPLFLYQISYSATSGPIQSFGASFVSQNLLTGSSGDFAFNPFTITDGTNTWVMGQGSATVGRNGGQCLDFGTQASFLFHCGVVVISDYEGGLVVFFRGSLPTQPGTFTPDEAFGVFTIDRNTEEGFQVPGTGSFNFEITEVPVPEPISLHVVIIGLAGLALTSWRLRRSKPFMNLKIEGT